MKKWGIPLLAAVFLLGLWTTGVWGYREYQARQSLQNRTESQYQRSFHELTWHMDMISGQLAQLLVSSSKEQAALSLATVWRQAFAAQANIGGLPLAFVPLSKSEKFLSDIGDVSYALLRRTTQSNSDPSESDRRLIEELYKQSQGLKEDLSRLASQVLNKQSSWTQVEVAAREAGVEMQDNTIIDGFKLMEKKMEEYPEINLGEDFTRLQPEKKVVQGASELTAQEAQEIARKWWFGDNDTHQVQIDYEGVGDIPTYGVELLPLAEEENSTFIDISKLDGTVIWAMKQKTLSPASLDLSQGEEYAQTFLKKHGYSNMVGINVERADNLVTFTFVPKQGEILLYPDQVKIQVALDSGEILGFEGTPYYMYHKTRELNAPKLDEDKLRQQISDYLKIETIRPALIADTWGKEIMTWEVRGSFAEEKFAIFYNADTGSEEEITRITPSTQYQFNVSA